MTLDDQVILEWKNKNTLEISGPIDASFEEDQDLKKAPNAFYLDLKGITRINSSGVRQWVRFIQSLDKKKVCYINVSCPVVEQFSMVSEFIGKYNTVKSFNARYVCNNCNSTEICNIIVGKDLFSRVCVKQRKGDTNKKNDFSCDFFFTLSPRSLSPFFAL